MPAQTVIKVRRDVAANWTSVNPILASGEIGFETDTNQLKVGNGTLTWTALPYASGAGGASVEVSTTAPADPEEGDVWFNSTEGRAYIYYDSFWVDLNPGVMGPAGKFTVSPTAPTDPAIGDGWFNSSTARLFIYYDNYWVEATSNYIGPTGPEGPAGPEVTSMNASAVVTTVSDKADNYTVLTSDKNSLIRVTAGTDKTITIGTDTTFQVGDRIDILQDGAGVVTVAVTGDATLAGRGTAGTAYTIGQQFDAVSVVCVDTNAYRIIGNAEAV